MVDESPYHSLTPKFDATLPHPASIGRQCYSVCFTKPLYGFPKSVIKKRQGRLGNIGWNASVKRCRHPARNARQCVGVSSQGNRQPHGVFVVLGFEKTSDRLGYGF